MIRTVFGRVPAESLTSLPSTQGGIRVYPVSPECPLLPLTIWDVPGNIEFTGNESQEYDVSIWGAAGDDAELDAHSSPEETFTSLEADGVCQRLFMTEGEIFDRCLGIVFCVDAADLYGDDVRGSLRGISRALFSLAARKLRRIPEKLRAESNVPYPTSPAYPFLPYLDILLCKVDSEKSGYGYVSEGMVVEHRSENRRELQRKFGDITAQELSEGGFSVTGIHHPGGYHTASSMSTKGAGLAAIYYREMNFDKIRDGNHELPAPLGVKPIPLQVNIHVQSIFHHSVFDSFSRIVSRIFPGSSLFGPIEAICNSLVKNGSLEKVLIINNPNRLILGGDSAPLSEDLAVIVLDAIDVVADISAVYEPTSYSAASGANAEGVDSDAFDDGAMNKTAGETGGVSSANDATFSLIRLSNGLFITTTEICKDLSLVTVGKENLIIRQENKGVNALSNAVQQSGAPMFGVGDAFSNNLTSALDLDNVMSGVHGGGMYMNAADGGVLMDSSNSLARGEKHKPLPVSLLTVHPLLEYDISVTAITVKKLLEGPKEKETA